MATNLEEFRKEEESLFTKIYRDTLKSSISSFLDSQDRKVASAIEKYMRQIAVVYGEYIARESILSGDFIARNVEDRISRSLEYIKVEDAETGRHEQKFYDIMELCKYPMELMKAHKGDNDYTLQNAIDEATNQVSGLVSEYFENYQQKNLEFNWNGYVKAYHNLLNKLIDQAARGNETAGLQKALASLNGMADVQGSEERYQRLKSARTEFNNATGFTNKTGTKESTSVYKLSDEDIYKMLSKTMLYLDSLHGYMPNSIDKINVENQIQYLDRLLFVMTSSANVSEANLVSFFLESDRPEMLAQLIKNMNEDWDIVGKLSSSQCKKIMSYADLKPETKAHMAIKSALTKYVMENYEKYVSDKAIQNSKLLAEEIIKLRNFCENSTICRILKLGKGIPDTKLRIILEDVQNDKNVDLVDVIPDALQRQIVQGMLNKGLVDSRVVYNSWKYATKQYIACSDMLDSQRQKDNFEAENGMPKSVALEVLWENVLGLNRINYYLQDTEEKSAETVSKLIKELEDDGIYADWSDATAIKPWSGRTLTQELNLVGKTYGKVLKDLSEEITDDGDRRL